MTTPEPPRTSTVLADYLTDAESQIRTAYDRTIGPFTVSASRDENRM
ncbi:hypothetical protein GPX89_39540 [Nocardia sp. ET3-3]|uniref:Uncharacterized protein n=1 Tax=Nocardia terrae TaxID=2675851 RepID=A0A7K1V9L6_9NOCA|nr:hypothetical protein [Nocardia terrae]MVU83320.1 hypothetical protein [Nocardia terrae]